MVCRFDKKLDFLHQKPSLQFQPNFTYQSKCEIEPSPLTRAIDLDDSRGEREDFFRWRISNRYPARSKNLGA